MKNYKFDNTPETAKALNRLSREQMKEKLLKDILCDLNICKLEGWDCEEYVKEIKELIGNIPKEKKQAEWVLSSVEGEDVVCSACGGAIWYYSEEYKGILRSRYCPNCGSKMKNSRTIIE